MQTWLFYPAIALFMLGTVARAQMLKILFITERVKAYKIYFSLNYALAEDLQDFDYEVRYIDVVCNPKLSLGYVIDLIEEGYEFNIAVGPHCLEGIQSVGLLTSKLNVVTLLSLTSGSEELEGRSTYSTLLGGSTLSQSTALTMNFLIEKFSWKTICIYSDEEHVYTLQYLANILNEKRYNTYAFIININDTDINVIRDDMRRAKTTCRIIIIISDVAVNNYTTNWIVAVIEEDMHKGDFVFIWVNLYIYAYIYFATFAGWYEETISSLTNINLAYKVLESVFMVTLRSRNVTQQNAFQSVLLNYTYSDWAVEYQLNSTEPSLEANYLYSILKLYASIANSLNGEGRTPTDGLQIARRARNIALNVTETGENILWNEIAEQAEDFELYDFVENSYFSVIAHSQYHLQDRELNFSLEFFDVPTWGDGTRGISNAPLDEPECGFFNDKCEASNFPYIFLTVSSVMVSIFLALLVAVLVKRIYAVTDWKVDVKDLHVVFRSVQSMPSEGGSIGSNIIMPGGISIKSCNVLAQEKVAFYKGVRVMMKPVRRKSVDLSNRLLKEITKMVSLTHNNIAQFIGANVEPPNMYILWEFCSKGNLRDIIAYSIFNQLDNGFKFSIAADVLAGLQYLHKYFKTHGNLRSSKVVIDNRWTAKLTDFGPKSILKGVGLNPEFNEDEAFQSLYWTAPEELLNCRDSSGNLVYFRQLAPKSWPKSQAGDMYSVGIIFKELFCMSSPYSEVHLYGITSKEIIEALLVNDKFRPSLEHLVDLNDGKLERQLKQYIASFWDPDPEMRPTAKEALQTMNSINPLGKSSIMDKMVNNMELYAKELENQVKKNTAELQVEKDKISLLLQTMLPSTVLQTLNEGYVVEAEEFRSCTLLISGISGFVDVVFQMSAQDVVSTLNSMYSMFDHIVQCFDVYKVCTIGDVYILASGLPQTNGNKHIANIANCALSMLHAVHSAHISGYLSEIFELKIGIHTGSIVAGVIGVYAPKYDLFGDTINTASRMMTKGKAMRIQMTLSAFEALSIFGGYYIADRGFISIKGKGQMHTFWLYGKNNFPIPNTDKLFQPDERKPTLLPVTIQIGDPNAAKDISEPVILNNQLIDLLFARKKSVIKMISEQFLGTEYFT